MKQGKKLMEESIVCDKNEGTKTKVLVPGMDTGQFIEACRPRALDEEEDTQKRLVFFQCSGCGGMHFRHAGYVDTLMPFVRGGDGPRVSKNSYCVNICVKCRKVFIHVNEKYYDVTDKIDVAAWEKAEKELNATTGPGGEC